MEREKFGNVFGAFTSALASEDRTTIDQPKDHSRVENSVEFGSSDIESSSSGTLKLIKKTADMTIWSVKRNTNDCSSSATEALTSRIETLQDQPETHGKAENSAQCGIQKECEQRTIIGSQSPSSGILRLMKKTQDITIWSNKPSNNDSSWSGAETPTSCYQSDIEPRKKRQRAKLDSHQLQVLEETFAVCPYIIGRQRRQLAKRLGLSKNKIGDWFEYRRRCMKRSRVSTNVGVTSRSAEENQTSHLPRFLDSRQLRVLNETFLVSPYILDEKRRELAIQLGLSRENISQWFEYHRRLASQAQAQTSGVASLDKENQIPHYSLARL